MAQYHSPENGYQLNIDRRYYSTLDIEGFSQMMKDPSYCYKFYWLEAIVHLISENVRETTFDAIIDEMIANAGVAYRVPLRDYFSLVTIHSTRLLFNVYWLYTIKVAA